MTALPTFRHILLCQGWLALSPCREDAARVSHALASVFRRRNGTEKDSRRSREGADQEQRSREEAEERGAGREAVEKEQRSREREEKEQRELRRRKRREGAVKSREGAEKEKEEAEKEQKQRRGSEGSQEKEPAIGQPNLFCAFVLFSLVLVPVLVFVVVTFLCMLFSAF